MVAAPNNFHSINVVEFSLDGKPVNPTHDRGKTRLGRSSPNNLVQWVRCGNLASQQFDDAVLTIEAPLVFEAELFHPLLVVKVLTVKAGNQLIGTIDAGLMFEVCPFHPELVVLEFFEVVFLLLPTGFEVKQAWFGAGDEVLHHLLGLLNHFIGAFDGGFEPGEVECRLSTDG
jgi:hypothetical protein